MKKLALGGFVIALCASTWAGDVVMKTESWANNDEEFARFDQRIFSMNPRNLLARRGVKVGQATDVSPQSLRYMTDGNAGVRCAEGRAYVNGRPSIIAFYLGKPKTIKQVGVFTFNSDARTNQDYEVRFFNNSAHPGVLPSFPAKPDLSTGDKVIGNNCGGFHSYFVEKNGGELAPGKADWVQFKIWRTYNVKAGTPAKAGNTAHSFTTVIELEVLGEESDVVVLTKEQIKRREAIRRAPKRPAYEKKATWQETMLAAREAILEWECLQDELALPDASVIFGTWYAIGPFARGSKAAREIEAQQKVNLKKQYPGKNGKPIGWQERKDFKDGRMIDLAAHFNAEEGDVIYLCRTVSAGARFDPKNPLPIGVGLTEGVVRLLPGGLSLVQDPDTRGAAPNQWTWDLTIHPREFQILAKLPRPKQAKWMFWFQPQPPLSHPGAGSTRARINRRAALFGRLRGDFPDPVSVEQITWEESDGIWLRSRPRTRAGVDKFLTDWTRGNPAVLKDQYKAAIAKRVAELEGELPDIKNAKLAAAIEDLKAGSAARDIAELRRTYYDAATLQEILAVNRRIKSVRTAIDDQRTSFGDRYPKAAEYITRAQKLQDRADEILARATSSGSKALSDVLTLKSAVTTAAQEILLANPLLDFDRLLLIKRRGNLGLPANWQGNCSLAKSGYDNEIAVLSPLRPDGKLTTLYKPEGGKFVGDVDLHFDADRMLFSSIGSHDRWQVFEIKADGTGLRQVTRGEHPDVDNYDACYLPDGGIIFCSTASFNGVPCVFGSSHVAMLYRMDADGGNVRQLCFEQDHDWCPCVLPDGRVLYTRWEYTDTPHSQTRLLFHMNPDGTGQMEYYGSNSQWPNGIFYARPIPGHPTKVVGIVSGHHGARRMGELIIFDTNKGRHEASGVVQRIPGHGKTVEPIIRDRLVDDSWPKFLHPYPLSEKYFLVSCLMTKRASWGIYLVDVFDNMTLIREEPGWALLEPLPFRKTKRPPVIADRTHPGRRDAVVYLADVYAGNGLKGIPRGTVKQLRLFTYHFAYEGMGGLLGVVGMDGPWDIKRVLGTVPVEEDGSAFFKVPANTPISVQPLDAEGKALQIMRSWMTAMPGEVLSCVGCHEPQNAGVPVRRTAASTRPPSDIKPWYGPTRGFSYPREVQPVIDKYCVGCHNGEERSDGKSIPDLRGTVQITDYRSVTPGTGGSRGGKFSVGYAELHRYVRRPGIESDYHLLPPMEFHADTTELVQMLRKGHHDVKLDEEAWDRLITWIDLNTPYHGTWHEQIKDPGELRQRRRELRKLYAGIDEDPEEVIIVKYSPRPETPAENAQSKPRGNRRPQSAIAIPKCDGWPFDAAEAKRRQAAAGSAAERTIDLGGGVSMELVLIPPGEFVMGDAAGCVDERPLTRVKIARPFWMGRMEVTNEQYARFDPTHDSHVESKNAYQFGVHGYPLDGPRQPVVRVSWKEAMAFCRWLSERTGERFTLPTEAQWEYACRAGTATSFWYGGSDADFSKFANMADAKLSEFASNPYTVDQPLKNPTKYDDWIPKDARFNDGGLVTVEVGKYRPNPWGLHDMHGNVWEWTLSTYRPYPYRPDDGRNDGSARGRKVVRGGSWHDRPKRCRSAFRLSYPSYQVVHDVGFRIVCTTRPE